MGMSEQMDATFDADQFMVDWREVEKVGEVKTMLEKAAADHHLYEQTQLNGVRDEHWACWYTKNAVCRGLLEVLDLPATVETGKIASFLMVLNAPKGVDWSTYAAEKLVLDFKA